MSDVKQRARELAERIKAYAGPQRRARLNSVPADLLHVWAKELTIIEAALSERQDAVADVEFITVDGRRYAKETVRIALLGLARDVIHDNNAVAQQPQPVAWPNGCRSNPAMCIHTFGTDPRVCLRCGWDFRLYGDVPTDDAPQPVAVYMTWPEDIRKKLSLHDLRRMSGWAPKSNVTDWRIDTSAGGPILVHKDCSVIEGEQARYVLRLIERDQAKQQGVEDELNFEPDDQHTVADMANVGYDLMQQIARNMPDYCWNESPAEIVCDLIDQRDEAKQPAAAGAVAAKIKGYRNGGSAILEWVGKPAPVGTLLYTTPPLAAGDGFVRVRKEAIDWLNGETDEGFECPPDRYFRGEPPRYWWRSVFREKAGLTAATGSGKGEL